jgi:ABC-type multidrug transport system ATPase subunit
LSSSSGIAAIEAAGLAKRYGRTWALRGIDLSVRCGETVALLGPNGSGKSTLLRILATAARPTRGDVRVFGFPTTSEGDAVRRRVGLLSDRPPLYDELTALENLTFAAAMYGLAIPDDRLRSALATVGLGHAAEARVRTFSQGMAQRLSLARSMLQGPDLVLLDEPYNALDVEGLRLVDDFLARLRSAGKTTILATHHIAKGLAQCERVVALRAGRVAFDGPTASFTASHAADEVGAWT